MLAHRARIPLLAVSLLALLLPRMPAHGQEAPPERFDGSPLQEAFAFYLGEWVPAADDPMLARRPERAGMTAFRYVLGANGSVLRMFEGLPGGDAERAAFEGTVVWDPQTDTLQFLGANTQWGFLFRGTFEDLGENRLARTYDVVYPEDRRLIPEPGIEGWVRRFREVLTPDGDNAFDATVEIWKDGAWQRWGPGTFRMVRSVAREADLPMAYAPLVWLIGTWEGAFQPDPSSPPPRMRFAWGPGKRHVVYRGWRPLDGALVPEYEGIIVWDGDAEKLRFLGSYASSGSPLTESGEVALLDRGTVQLHMRVHYGEGRTLPWSGGAVAGPGGHTLEFLRTFTPEGPGGLTGTFVMKRGPVWEKPDYGPDLPNDRFSWRRVDDGD